MENFSAGSTRLGESKLNFEYSEEITDYYSHRISRVKQAHRQETSKVQYCD